jgi:hypothetical protein
MVKQLPEYSGAHIKDHGKILGKSKNIPDGFKKKSCKIRT